MEGHTLTTKALALLLTLSIANPLWAATAAVPPQLPDPGSVMGVSRQDQEQLGLKAMGEIYKQMPILPDSSPVTQYIQQLGRKLQTVIPAQYSWPYQFHVVQQSEINAFALPGGPIFVNIGTINAADNEAELAGVMAHEMSHVYMQHSAKQAVKESLAQGVLGVIGGILGDSTMADIARVGIQVGAGTVFLKYSRADEAQADAVGAIIMYKAGYDPHALAAFFEKLEKEGGSNGPQFLSDHPNPGNRTQAIDGEVANWPPENYLATSQSFFHVKEDAKGVKAYTGQQIADGAQQGLWAEQNHKAGAVPGAAPPVSNQGSAPNTAAFADVSYDQIKPNSTFTQFEQNAFLISYPSNWRGASDGTSATIAPPAGVAQGAIAYGLIVSTAPMSGTLNQATQALIQYLQKTNPGLHRLDEVRKIRVGDVRGRSVDLAGNSPIQRNGQPVPERDWLVTVPRPDGDLLYLVFIAPESDFSQLRPVYQKMLDSLQVK